MDRTIPRRTWVRVAGALLLALSAAVPAPAQFREVAAPDHLEPQQVVNLFATWDGRYACDGLFVDLPEGWALRRVRLLRNGYVPEPARTHRLAEGVNRYVVLPDRALRTTYDVVLQVQAGAAPGPARWRVTPFMRAPNEPASRIEEQTDLQLEGAVRVVVPESPSENRVLSFERAARRPLWLRRQALPELSPRAPHTIEFWMRTTGLDEVILSAWDGDEQRPYPFEFMIGPDGRLYFYRGRPGRHQAMTTHRPVADGRWHHVALTHDPDAGWTRLYLDGAAADSLYEAAPPPVPMPAVVGLGGRPQEDREETTASALRYTGLLDEVRFWPEVRLAAVLRETMRRPLGTTRPATPSDPRRLTLGFEEPVPADVLVQPAAGLRRVPSDLAFYQPVRRVQAVPEDGAVIVTWTSADPRTTAFFVERSVDGTAFDVIAEVEAGTGGEAGEDAGRFVYRDADVDGPVAYYRVRQRFEGGAERTSSIVKVGLGAAEVAVRPAPAVHLSAYPNPFNPVTTIAYEVEEGQHVQITVTNLAGQQVAQLVDAYREPGRYQVVFDGADLPSGPYLVRVRTATGSTTHKIMLAK